MRKLFAVLTTMSVMAATIALLALPAGAGSYPPDSTGPSATTAGGDIAFTGSNSGPLVIVGIVAVALGMVLLVAMRRRSAVRAQI